MAFPFDIGVSAIPIWAPNERNLPNADYGRVAALKLAKDTLSEKAESYARQDTNWPRYATLGRYHFYLLGRSRNILKNDARRAVAGNLTSGYYFYPYGDPDLETSGPIHQKFVMEEFAELSRIYGIPIKTVIGAFLNFVNDILENFPAPVGLGSDLQPGYNVAKYNPGALYSLWGTTPTGYPKSFNYNSRNAARGDYKGGSKMGRKRRRKSMRF